MSDPLCILIHGFSGSPIDLEPLGQALEDHGYQVQIPLLPGHRRSRWTRATSDPPSTQDAAIRPPVMDRVHASSWISTIDTLVRSALEKPQPVHLIGFSMGALLASLMATVHPVSSLVLLSPPVYVATPRLLLKRALNTLRESATGSTESAGSRFRQDLSWLHAISFHNIRQFRGLVAATRRMFPVIESPVCIMHGAKDLTVDPRSATWVYNAVASQDRELYLLPNSGHPVCEDVDAELVTETVMRFVDRYARPASVELRQPVPVCGNQVVAE